METSVKKTISQIGFTILTVVFFSILLYLFYLNIAYFLFKNVSLFINNLIAVPRTGMLPSVNEIPLILWLSSILFLTVTFSIMRRSRSTILIFPLKINFILFSIYAVYMTYFLVVFYLITFRVIDYNVNDLVWII